MKRIVVPRADVNRGDIDEVARVLGSLETHNIDVVNWPDRFPYCPQVLFRIAHTGDSILLQYQVKEHEIIAEVTEDNGKVSSDSCVEMFITFDDTDYYNAEFSCIGKMLLGSHPCSGKTPFDKRADECVLKSILREPSLGTSALDRQYGDFNWTLTLVIPCSAFWKNSINDLSGQQAKANFYKCGDNLSTPHYVAWTKIDTLAPSFHQPSFFGELTFAK